ncbi:MAG TPA: exodeoxyribonuclease VII large subunit [Gemmatimonadales bacterium]|nr:exodeoxyribonuclease VII large subunit [Gemmatimonadales bacterium]
MDRPVDMFGAVAPDGAWSVSAVNRRAKAAIEQTLEPMWVEGEMTGLKDFGGNLYFSLRDSLSQLRCVMFRDDARRLPAHPTEGMKVYAFGRATIYEKRGEYQLNVTRLMSTEAGGLFRIAFEKAKAALAKDGILDRPRRQIPPYPRWIAVVTSVDGAALRDILKVASQRWPVAQIAVIDTRVQGEGAVDEVVRALQVISKLTKVDVAIVGRGGGSKEDLQVFNEERVARAVAAVPVPVISAVGHETDVTLCDLVADHRAATPTDAARLATPDRAEVQSDLEHLGARLARGLEHRTTRMEERLARMTDGLLRGVDRRLESLTYRLSVVSGRLDALSPLGTFARGFAVPRDGTGRVLRRMADFHPGDPFDLRVVDGTIKAQVRKNDGN